MTRGSKQRRRTPEVRKAIRIVSSRVPLFLRAFVICLAMHGVLASASAAQDEDADASAWRGASIGGVLIGAVPVGEFETYVDAGYGLGLFGAYAFDPGGHFGVRFDFAWIRYGSETTRRPLSTTIPFVFVDVTTANDIYSFFLSPELAARLGFLHPYATGGIGLSVFTTKSSVESENDDEPFAETTHLTDPTFAGLAGIGIDIDVARFSSGTLRIELSARRVWNGTVRYLREGSIQEPVAGTFSFTPIESVADFWLLQFGVRLAG